MFCKVLRLLLFCFIFRLERAYENEELNKLINAFSPRSLISLSAISFADGKTLFDHHEEDRVFSSSINKLFVAAAALKCLGPDYCFKTDVTSNATPVDSVLKGDLVFHGSADPTLHEKDLEDLIVQIKLLGISKIEGDLIFDNSEFDEIGLSPGWMWADREAYTQAVVDPLLLDEGKTDIWLKTNQEEAHVVCLSLDSLFFEYPIKNETKVIDSKLSTKIQGILDIDAKKITLEGQISSQNGCYCAPLYMKKPSAVFALKTAFLLKKFGIEHKGNLSFKNCEAGKHLLATHSSTFLSIIIQKMIKTDDDLCANMLLKKLGRVKYGKPGTWPSGAQAVRDFLKTYLHDLSSSALIIDGAGCSPYNRVNAKLVVNFLYKMQSGFKYGPEFLSSLSLGGKEGLLKKRGKEKPFHGSLRGIRADFKGGAFFCGYLPQEDGSQIAFCLMMKDKIKVDPKEREAFEESVCRHLYKRRLRR